MLKAVPNVNCIGVIPEAAQPLWSAERSTGRFLQCDVAAQISASMPLVSEAQREVFSFLALSVT